MEKEVIRSSLTFRTDLIGDLGRSDQIKGYKAESLLKRMIEKNKHIIKQHLYKKYNIYANVYFLHEIYKEKYKRYLKDPESRKYILEKYADKMSVIEVLCGRITDLCAQDCIDLLEFYEIDENPIKVIDKIMINYKSELKSLFVYDIEA